MRCERWSCGYSCVCTEASFVTSNPIAGFGFDAVDASRRYSEFVQSHVPLIYAREAILETPPATPGRRDLQIRTTAIEQSHGFFLRRGILNVRGEPHGGNSGIRMVFLTARTPADMPRRPRMDGWWARSDSNRGPRDSLSPAVSGGSGLSLHPGGVRDALACH